MYKKVSLLAATLVLTVASGAFAQSVLIGNAPGGGDIPVSGGNINFDTTGEIGAFSFRTPTGTDYEINSISLFFSHVGSIPTPVVRVHDASNAVLGTLTNPGSLSTGENVFSLSSAIELNQDTVYKFSVYNSAVDPASNNFHWSSYGTSPAPSSGLSFTNEGGLNGYTYSTSGAPGTVPSSALPGEQYMGAFTINGQEVVPEPATMTLLTIGAVALLRKKRK